MGQDRFLPGGRGSPTLAQRRTTHDKINKPQNPPLTRDDGAARLGRSVPDWLCDTPRHPGDSDGLPLNFPPPHPDAVGTRVDEAAGFIESCLHRLNLPGLRWWQWACLARGLEVDDDGMFVWRRLITSASRQSGKSVLLAGLALWRSHELQHTVLHTSLNLAQAGAIQEPWWDMAGDEDAYVRRRPDD